ncbi:paraflagellar rod protein 1D [Lotmaria passim]
MTVDDATGLEAARKQKIHNLKLKTACLENEELVQELHISDWSETQRQKLRGAHEKGEELLAAVEVGTKWNLMEAYDLAKLMRVCGLEMSQRELYRPEDKPQFMDIIGVKKVLQDLRQNRNKTRVVSFTQLVDSSIAKMEKVEEELRRSQLDATQLAQVPTRTVKMMEDIMNATQIQNALASTDDQMKTQLAQLEKTNEIQNVAMHDGEMQVAEEQMWTKVQLQERLVELLKDKFGLIGKCEEENAQFKEIYEVQKQANQETSQMKDAKRRLKQRCETDLKHIQDAIQKADLEDAEAAKRYVARFFRDTCSCASSDCSLSTIIVALHSLFFLSSPTSPSCRCTSTCSSPFLLVSYITSTAVLHHAQRFYTFLLSSTSPPRSHNGHSSQR